jgi:phosphopantetheine--protein transferase-like protein
MEEKLKEIVSVFIKVAPGEIGPATRIDRSAVQSSILLHRMYVRLAQEGVVPEDNSAIKVFGDLLRVTAIPAGSTTGAAAVPATGNGSAAFTPAGNDSSVSAGRSVTSTGIASQGIASQAVASPGVTSTGIASQGVALGIDIEDIAALPQTNDFRKEPFYTMNFTPEEIAYCILQPDPYASFTGLFAAKEAIVKAGARRRGEPFNTIHIRHSGEGKPLYSGMAISISHTPAVAVAVAVHAAGDPAAGTIAPAPPPFPDTSGPARLIAWLALLVGMIALLAALIHRV